MSKRGRSEIWDHTQKLTADTVQCKLCKKEFAYSGGTSTLSRHLQVVHANIVNQPSSSATSTPTSHKSVKTNQPPLVFGPRKFGEARTEKANALLTKFIVTNMLPLSLVDDEAFREFVNFLEPEYKLPCRQTFTARLDGLKTELCKTVTAEMAAVSSVAVTTDIWTSMSNEPYISLTGSYITSDWQLVSRTLNNEPMEERHTQVHKFICLYNHEAYRSHEFGHYINIASVIFSARQLAIARRFLGLVCPSVYLSVCLFFGTRKL